MTNRTRLTDEEIDAIAEGMEGGLDGFLKQWGWRQFARAVLDEQERRVQDHICEMLFH